MATKLTEDQRYRISVQLVSLIVEGFAADRNLSEGWEQSTVRVFACSWACNQTAMIDDEDEAHALCDELFTSYYGIGNWSRERIETHSKDLNERFAEYYRATDLIGQTSECDVDFDLPNVSGSIPFSAFVRFETAFWHFANPLRELSKADLLNLARDPMKGRFGLFLTVWNEAEERIQAVLIPEGEDRHGR